jgi:hypothetical protein
MTKFNISILIFILLASCDNNIGIIYPTFGDSSVLTNAKYLDKSIIENIQGIYSSSNPDKRLVLVTFFRKAKKEIHYMISFTKVCKEKF